MSRKKLALTKTTERAKRWQKKFVAALAKTPSVTHACQSAGISRDCAYAHRKKDPEFARAWLDAIEKSVDDLEAKAFKLALDGDDAVAANLITWLLRCHRPVPYDPVNRNEVAVAGGIIFLPAKKEGAE